jgi:hypothetical protein
MSVFTYASAGVFLKKRVQAKIWTFKIKKKSEICRLAGL